MTMLPMLTKLKLSLKCNDHFINLANEIQINMPCFCLGQIRPRPICNKYILFCFSFCEITKINLSNTPLKKEKKLERKNKKNTTAKTVSWVIRLLERKNKETERIKTSAQSLEKIFPEE